MKKICRSFIVILLVLSMLAGGSDSLLNAAADAMQGTVYVSDVQIFQSSSLDECVQLCREAGYIPYERDLNSGAVEKVSFGTDIDAPCVMLGYTTTTNVNLAVTDISLLRMGEGYEIREYQAIAAALLAKNQNYAEGLAAAAADFAENYDKGAPSAVQAYKMLDLLYVDDLDKHSMSGYIEAKSNDSPFLELIRSSETVMNYLRSYEENTYRDYDWSEHVPLIISLKATPMRSFSESSCHWERPPSLIRSIPPSAPAARNMRTTITRNWTSTRPVSGRTVFMRVISGR